MTSYAWAPGSWRDADKLMMLLGEEEFLVYHGGNHMFTRSVAVMVVICIALSTFGSDLRDNEMIIGGGYSEVDGHWVSSPSLYLRRHTPGVSFGMVKVPGKDRVYAYVLVIKGDPMRTALARYDSKGGVSESTLNSHGFVEIANRKVAFRYTAEVTGNQPVQEVLSINDKALEISQGRVVLIDLSSENVNWKQLQIELPTSPGITTLTAQVESQSKKVLEHLRRESKDVREFLR